MNLDGNVVRHPGCDGDVLLCSVGGHHTRALLYAVGAEGNLLGAQLLLHRVGQILVPGGRAEDQDDDQARALPLRPPRQAAEEYNVLERLQGVRVVDHQDQGLGGGVRPDSDELGPGEVALMSKLIRAVVVLLAVVLPNTDKKLGKCIGANVHVLLEPY